MRLLRMILPLVAAAPLASQESPQFTKDRATGAATVTTQDLESWLTTLASDEFGGRATGTDDFQKAADFVRDNFKSFGLEPGAAGGKWYQPVPWTRVDPDLEETHVTFSRGDDKLLELRSGAGLGGSVFTDATSEGGVALVVVQDLANPGLDELDLKGKIAILCQHPGAAEKLKGRQRRFASYFMNQVANRARQAGAADAVLVESDADAKLEIRGVSRSRGGNRAQAGRGVMPNALRIGAGSAAKILKAAGLNADVMTGDKVMHDLSAIQAAVQVQVESDQAPAYNVCGVVRGTDPTLKDEYVVIGSHLDHIGKRGNQINNGADDDGSGTVGVLALARAFAKNKVRPRRSIFFVCFCGEENGLVGSRYFANNSPIPLEKIVAELQMDMIGRNESKGSEKAEDNLNCLHLVGTKKMSRDLHSLCMKKNDVHAFDLEWDEEGVFSRSDHANFAAKGIPIAFFFTGFHPDYHRPTDTVEKIDFPKLRRIALYVYDIGFDLAQSDTRPFVDEDLWAKNRRSVRGVEVPAAPVRKK